MLYQSGDLFLPTKARAFLETPLVGSYNETFYITYWSLLHFVSGIFFALIARVYKLQSPYLYGFFAHGAWELWQVYIGMNKPWNLTGHNGIGDITTDTVLFMLGLFIYQII